MKTGTFFVVDGKYTDHYAIGEIDCTHIYLKTYKGNMPKSEEITKGHVFHVAQLKGMAEALFETVIEWLAGAREIENVGFLA